MATEKITLAYMGQHTSTAGLRVPCPENRYGDDWRDSLDLMVFDGTEAEHVAFAREMLAQKPWCGPYYSRVCRDILEYFGEPETPVSTPEPVYAEWETDQYVATAPSGAKWYSRDGNMWSDEAGLPIESAEFDDASILLAGGPAAGQRVG